MAGRIPIAGPSITAREVDAVTAAAREGWYANAGAFHAPFESAFAAYVGRRHAMALPSGTSALHLALAALGIGQGDEVIVPDMTWIASAAPITYVGAQPVFADIDPVTWCLSIDSFVSCLSPRTKAVIVVDLYGNMSDLDELVRIADEHGVAVIEDAAQAIGSRLRGRPAGGFGVAGAFSFHGSKTLTTGEGGMLVTDSEEMYQRAAVLRDHGRPPGDTAFFNDEVAYKYKMSAMQAALGLAQLERVDELVGKKRALFEWYQRELSDVGGLTLNQAGPGVDPCFWMVTVLLDEDLGLDKGALIAQLAEVQVDSRPIFHPLSALPAYRQSPAADRARHANPTAYRLSPRGVNLPSALVLDRQQVTYVCDQVRRIVERPRH